MHVLWLLAACAMTGAPILDTADPTASMTTPAGGATSGSSLVPGDLVITEVMPDPAAVDGDFGEYVEVTSLAGDALELAGLTVVDDDGAGFTVTGSLVVPAGGRVVFAPSDDPEVNGGLPVDYAYAVDDFKLGNEGDTVTLLAGDDILDLVAFDEGTFEIVEGASLSLSQGATDPVANDDPAAWCPATSTYGEGDAGTPGAPNDPC